MDEMKRIALELLGKCEHCGAVTAHEARWYRDRLDEAQGRAKAFDEAAKRGYEDAVKGGRG